MKDSKIEWTDHTFNPWVGCTRVSPGCVNCYAEAMMADRYKKVKWGPQGERKRTSADYWKQPLKWNREAEAAGERRRVFCASLADVFEDKPDQREEMNEWRTDLFDLIYETPALDWLLLTKRPENVTRMVPWMYHHPDFFGWPANVWIGTSVENQEYADKRIPELLQIPAAVRFLSVEPMLGPIDLGLFGTIPHCTDNGGSYNLTADRINWVIVGGESGPDARPMHPDWVRSIRDQCLETDVPFFFKQWGEYAPVENVLNNWYLIEESNNPQRKNVGWVRSVGDEDNEAAVARVGKHRAGRLLDGREWNEYPVTDKAMEE